MICSKAVRLIRGGNWVTLCWPAWLGPWRRSTPWSWYFADREPDFRCLGSGCDPRAKSVCRFEPGSWEWVGGLESSTVAQLGLVSGQKFKVGFVQAVFFGGCTIGESFYFLFLAGLRNKILFFVSLCFILYYYSSLQFENCYSYPPSYPVDPQKRS